MKWLTVCCAILGLALAEPFAAGQMALAQETVQPQDNEVRFCFNSWPPYVKVEQDQSTGITVDILREAARRAGLKVSFRELPWNRCLQNVRDGEFDAVLDAAERTEFLRGPVSFSLHTYSFWIRDDVIVADFVRTLIFARESGLNIRPLFRSHSFDRLYPPFNRSRPQLHVRFNEALAGMLEDGAIDGVYR